MKKRRILISSIVSLIIFLIIILIMRFQNRVIIKDYNILHDEKFGGVFADISIDEFNDKGFVFGDSVDVEFSNGNKLSDIPYYNGYYVQYGEPQVVGYPGYEYIKICLNYGEDLWEKYKLSTEDKVTIKLHKPEKYLNIQEARDIEYSDIQGDQSDIEFANFRSVKTKNMKENVLYRSASPVDNQHKRASVTDKLIKDVGIKYIVNLSDSDEDLVKHINKEDFNSPYFLSLYEENKIVALSMSMRFEETSFSNSLIKGLEKMANNDGPYLVHCVEGKDRTGFVIMVLEALGGATYQEMVDDYMETYKNYYGITLESDKIKYNTIKELNIDFMLRYITGSDENTDLNKIDYEAKTREFLLSKGISENNLEILKEKLYN